MQALLLVYAWLFAMMGVASAQVGPTSASLASFSSGSDGLLMNGGYSTGCSVAQVGDYNGDGIVDFVVGSKSTPTNGVFSGVVILILGNTTDWSANIDVSSVTSGDTMRKIYGSDNGISLGSSVGGAGDVNLDGFDDLLVGISGSSSGGLSMNGAILVVFGLAPPYTDIIFNAAFVASSGTGYAIFGSQDYGQLAFWSSNTRTLGDINGDDYEDFVVTAMYSAYASRNNAGLVLIVYGSNASPANANAADIGVTRAGVVLGGSAVDGNLGYSVDGLGDFNGDAIWDLVVSEANFSPVVGGITRAYAGAVYVLFTEYLVSQDMAAFSTGTSGVRILGAVAGDALGYGVAFADVNGDTVSDVVIGAAQAASGAGKVYVVFGATVPFTADIDLAALTAGAAGYTIIATAGTPQLGWSVYRVGDMNSDGVDDFAFGAKGANQVSIVYGSATVPTANIDIATATAAQMYTISSAGGDSVFGGFDVTGDGYPDLLVGAVNDNQAALLKGPLPRAATSKPSAVPTVTPSAAPSGPPSVAPSALLTPQPSATPSAQPTVGPTEQPTVAPSAVPSVQPSSVPSTKPLSVPTSRPSTLAPTVIVHASSDRTTAGHLTDGGLAGVLIGGVFLVLLLATAALFYLAACGSSTDETAPVTQPASPPEQGYEMTNV